MSCNAMRVHRHHMVACCTCRCDLCTVYTSKHHDYVNRVQDPRAIQQRLAVSHDAHNPLIRICEENAARESHERVLGGASLQMVGLL
jgi:hypothetical protein